MYNDDNIVSHCLSVCLFRIATISHEDLMQARTLLEQQISHVMEPIMVVSLVDHRVSLGAAVFHMNLRKSFNLSQYPLLIYKSGVNDPCLKGF